MKLIFNVLGKVWGLAIFVFVGLQFYKSSGNVIPDLALGYVENIEEIIFAFLQSDWFFVVFIFAWFSTSYLLSKKSGWQVLAKKYHLVANFDSDLTFSSYSGKIGGVSNKGTLRLSTNTKGLYATMLLPFRFGHKKLFVPWSDIESVQLEQSSNTLKFNFRYYSNQTFEIYNYKNLDKFVPIQLLKSI